MQPGFIGSTYAELLQSSDLPWVSHALWSGHQHTKTGTNWAGRTQYLVPGSLGEKTETLLCSHELQAISEVPGLCDVHKLEPLSGI